MNFYPQSRFFYLLQAQFVRVENNMRELNLSVDLMKKESRKLVERAALAEKDMRQGQSDLAYGRLEYFLYLQFCFCQFFKS